MRLIYACLGFLSLGLAMLGILLPLLPTVPFLLLAAFSFAKSSERMHDWLVSHRTFGPLILDWNERGAIRPAAKKAATVSIAAVFSLSLAFGAPNWIVATQAIVLSCVLIFIWSRPSG